jgi:hypothetical protein
MSPMGTESPLYRMWKERLDAELAQQAAWAAHLAEREMKQASWHEAWLSYRARLDQLRPSQPRPRWWNVIGWILWLLRLHAPGRPN